MQFIEVLPNYKAYTKLDDYDKATLRYGFVRRYRPIPSAYYKRWAKSQPSLDELGVWFMGVMNYRPVQMVSALDLMEASGWKCPVVHAVKTHQWWDNWYLDNFKLTGSKAEGDFLQGSTSDIEDKKYY